ncbi:MAG: S1 RNA-binding domain-containing protein [Chloroflexi bacterium]|nr:S1 RNA-binding domain-containing protein [Chloroflexota bacterium]
MRVESYGAFIDIGAERPGMAHISELAEGFVKQASDVVKVGDKVQVRVLKYNRKKKQIDLSMKPVEESVASYQDDEDDEPQLTAMALALQKAMKGTSSDSGRSAATNRKAKQRQQQEDIIARTLRSHGSN